MGFPGSSVGKGSDCNAGDAGSIPELGISPGEGNGNPLQYSCLENSMDRGAWWVQSMGSQRVGHNCVTNFHFQIVVNFVIGYSLITQNKFFKAFF